MSYWQILGKLEFFASREVIHCECETNSDLFVVATFFRASSTPVGTGGQSSALLFQSKRDITQTSQWHHRFSSICFPPCQLSLKSARPVLIKGVRLTHLIAFLGQANQSLVQAVSQGLKFSLGKADLKFDLRFWPVGGRHKTDERKLRPQRGVLHLG